MYKQLSHEDLCTVETCQLLSEHEQQLKSAENYRVCFLKLVQECSLFNNYLEKNIVPWAADWPGWYYPKKNIAQGKCQLLQQSVIPEQGEFHMSLNDAEDRGSMRQGGRVVRPLDLKSGNPEFKFRPDHQLDFFLVAPGSTPRLRLYIASWFPSCQLGFLTC